MKFDLIIDCLDIKRITKDRNFALNSYRKFSYIFKDVREFISEKQDAKINLNCIFTTHFLQNEFEIKKLKLLSLLNKIKLTSKTNLWEDNRIL